MTIYKAFADQEELSKTLMMKKYLGYSDRDIEDNYRQLIKDKQLIAVGDFFAEQVSEENPPVDFKSPIRLKKDVDAEEKVNANIPADANKDTEGNEGSEESEDGEDAGATWAQKKRRPTTQARQNQPEKPVSDCN